MNSGNGGNDSNSDITGGRADGTRATYRDPEEFQTLHELVQQARINLNRNAWDYLIGGAETETTVRRNRRALDSLAFRPRVLRDVSAVDCRRRLFGRELRLPLLLAPIGSLETFGSGGGIPVTRAAAGFGVAHMLSSVCATTIEEMAAAAPDGMNLFQLYVRGDNAWIDDYVRRAVDGGFTAFCLTVDTAHYSRRERDIAKRFVKPWRARATGGGWQQALSWDQVKHLRDRFDIPLVLKGIATAEDAALACEHGVEAVYVSNHGGRQLDHGRGALEMLPEVVREVDGRAAVLIDGGVMRGTDVVKAIARGADAVGIGRLECVALAAAGEAGVRRMLELLEEEISVTLGLLGVSDWDQLDGSYLHPAEPVGPSHVLSAFPLLGDPFDWPVQ